MPGLPLAAELLGLVAQAEPEGDLSGRAQLIAVAATVVFLGFVIELVRRRRLVERYALLWMSAALLGVVLAVWNDGLGWIADLVGIASPPNALFLIGLVAVVALLLNLSVAISRLSEETKILAQTVSRLDAELREQQAASRNGAAEGDSREATQAEPGASA